jgi:THO complex subunit 3
MGSTPWSTHEIRSAHRNKVRTMCIVRWAYSRCRISRALPGSIVQIFCLDWNCTGTLLATGSSDQSVKVWKLDAASGRSLSLESDMRAHEDSVMYLRFHPSEPDRLASTSGREKSLKFWDARASKNTATLGTPGNNLYFAWSKDGNYIVVGNQKDVLSTVDVRKMSIINQVEYKYQVNEPAFLRDNLLLGTGKHGSALEVVSFPGMEPIASYVGHTASVLSVAVDPMETYVATGGADALVCLWDARDFVNLKTFYHMENPIRAISFSHDAHFMAMTGDDACLYIENLSAGLSETIDLKMNVEESSWNPTRNVLAYPQHDSIFLLSI